jgi:hypothetical protein
LLPDSHVYAEMGDSVIICVVDVTCADLEGGTLVTADEIRECLERGPLFDGYIVKHGFVPFLRDYDLVVVAVASPPRRPQYLYRFSHVPFATVTTAVSDEVWRKSWADDYTNFQTWQRVGSPPGYVWGVCYSVAYPGAKCVEDSILAREWSSRLGKPMHEVQIKTNGHDLTLIFHDLNMEEQGEASESVSV